MGSDPARDPQAYDDEQPQHRVILGAYRIGRYPVTVAEYACFVRAGQRAPGYWRIQLRKLLHPMVHVSWRDATAYAAWLAQCSGAVWRLPTEAEWEKAARGTDGRIYPWGDAFDQSRCNSHGTGKRGTTRVETYANGASPCGAQDLVGNITEWTSSLYQPYPYRADDGRERASAMSDRVLRGGCWTEHPREVRAAIRGGARPPVRTVWFGFRVLQDLPVA